MKTLYLIRHGQTLFNQQKKIQGFCDSPLTELGKKQALIAKDNISSLNITFNEAYCSTSERAVDTLELITDIPYTREKNLREWNFGSLEAEGEHLNPPLPYRDFFVQFGGEDEFDFRTRISEAILKIMNTSKGDNILIVSHGAAIAQFYRVWENNSEVKRNGRIQNCSILKYSFSNNNFVLQEIINHDFSTIE
ncbi:histidine phosphatase family protein [Erysipelothrix sp. HDW6A]|uniref:histidine phosphatase family protein n=1 Tax=Erysipelothrix sp. HDW6A TaxID=2714928 RepID=UPI0014085F73|nr:histidine phosphatase family protein [Erysipelothrix sp. HDW6A]QIK57125.1 histidine phosphatase family protein [Erysipelothrix sp. HDW6A]